MAGVKRNHQLVLTWGVPKCVAGFVYTFLSVSKPSGMSEEEAPASAYLRAVPVWQDLCTLSGVSQPRTLSAPLPLQHTHTHNNTYLHVHTYAQIHTQGHSTPLPSAHAHTHNNTVSTWHKMRTSVHFFLLSVLVLLKKRVLKANFKVTSKFRNPL